jgi:hypothetical protein
MAGSGPKLRAYPVISSAPVGVTYAPQQTRGRGRRNRKHAVRAFHRAAPHVQRRRHHLVGAEPLHAVHGADDVDDRIERADFMEVHVLERRLMDLGLCLPGAESADRPIAAAMSFKLRCSCE